MYSTKQAAVLCDRDWSHVRRLCKQLDIGHLDGRRRWLTDQDLQRLRQQVELHGNENKRFKSHK